MNVAELCKLLDTCTDDELQVSVYIRHGIAQEASALGSASFGYIENEQGTQGVAELFERPSNGQRDRVLVLGPILHREE